MIKPHGRMKGKGYEMKNVLECIIRLLPVEKEDIIPVSFLFGLLRCAFTWNVGKEYRFEVALLDGLQDDRLKINQGRLCFSCCSLMKKQRKGIF